MILKDFWIGVISPTLREVRRMKRRYQPLAYLIVFVMSFWLGVCLLIPSMGDNKDEQ